MTLPANHKQNTQAASLRYGSAAVALLLATLLRFVLDPLLAEHYPFVTYFVAIVVVTWYAGLRPALLTLIVGGLLAAFLFAEPRGSLEMAGMLNWLVLGFYTVTGVLLIALIEWTRSNRAQAERSEQHFRRLLEAGNVGIGLVDEKGGIDYANPALLRMLGYTAEEVAAGELRWDRITPPEFAGITLKVIREIRATGATAVPYTPYEKEYIAKDGRRVPVLISLVPFELRPDRTGIGAMFVTDLTGIKQAQEAVRVSEERFRTLAERAPDFIARLDPELRHLYVNPAVEKIAGRRREDFIGKTNRELGMPEENLDLWEPSLKAVFETGQERTIEFRFPGPAGELHFESRLVPEMGASGQVETVLAIARDITERKRTETALQERVKEMQCMYAVARITQRTNEPLKDALLEVLDALAVAYRYPDVTCVRITVEDQVFETPNFRQTPWQQSHDIQLDGHVIGAVVVGYLEERPPEDEGPFLKEERALIGAVASMLARNIQDCRAQEKLVQSEKRFREVVGLVPDILYRAQLPGCETTFISSAVQSQLGFSEQEWLADPQRWLHQLHAEDRERLLPELETLLVRDESFRVEYRLWHKDGRTLRWFEDRAHIERDEAGQPLGVFGAMSDITERKRLEEELREAHRRKDEFLAVLTHELRNPLAPISNALQLLKRGGVDRSVTDAALTMAERQMGQLLRLVDDLLDISRITRGKITLRKERVALDAVIRSAMEMSLPRILTEGHEVKLALPEDEVYLQADLTRLAQAVSNLLINAAKYTKPGGHIELRAQREGREAVIAVQDTGIGIPPEELPKLFGLFAQLERPAGQRRAGLGVGLALVKSLVELHGGHVKAESAGPGKGSTFTIRLPTAAASPSKSEPSGERPPEAKHAQDHRRVLVVDDEADVADSMALLLRSCGHEVFTAYGGAEAIEVARERRPDCILLDVGMPEMDGYEVARRLRQLFELQSVQLIALTGWGQEEDRRRSLDAGFDHHLVKPVDLATLESVVCRDRRGAAHTAPAEAG